MYDKAISCPFGWGLDTDKKEEGGGTAQPRQALLAVLLRLMGTEARGLGPRGQQGKHRVEPTIQIEIRVG